jgi:hypothetical protein
VFDSPAEFEQAGKDEGRIVRGSWVACEKSGEGHREIDWLVLVKEVQCESVKLGDDGVG